MVHETFLIYLIYWKFKPLIINNYTIMYLLIITLVF